MPWDWLQAALNAAFHGISFLGAAVIIWGSGEAAYRFAILRLNENVAEKGLVRETDGIRERLGAQILLGLDLFIAADIIRTVVAPSWQNLGLLAVIVGIRVFLSYFLMRELEQTERHMRENVGERSNPNEN